MRICLDRDRFGPWALVTGASAGLGYEFARQISRQGINVVLVARRKALLENAAACFQKEFGVKCLVVAADLSQEGFIDELTRATENLDIGLVVSNAGTGSPGKFLSKPLDELTALLRLNALAHLKIAHLFGKRLVKRGRGGIIFVGALGADKGIPNMANDAAAKAYVHSLGESLHVELKNAGVNVTVLPPGPTETPVLEKFGLSAEMMPMKPMKVEPCVEEALDALIKNRSMIVPGILNRLINTFIPPSIARSMMARMFEKSLSEHNVAKIRVGDSVKPLHLATIQNQPIDVPDDSFLVHLQFRRFAGCPSCNLHLRSIAARHGEINAAGIREVAVFHSTVESMLPHQGDLPFPVVADPKRILYQRFGVETKLKSILAPAVWLSWIQGALTLKTFPEPPRHGETKIGLPADFLIAQDGTVLACKYGKHAYDQWTVDELLELSKTVNV